MPAASTTSGSTRSAISGASHGPRQKVLALAVSFALSVGMLVGLGGGEWASGAAAPKTIVSLTFDDGNADQLAAEQVMKAHGLVGTFFITTGWIDTASYLTQSNLHAMAADGNEIGGHTVTHPDLTTVSSATATAEVCGGRTTLAGWGFAVTNFAYPFAAENAALEKIVKNCGYTSARNLGDIRSPASCATCPYAETIPPANPYNTAAPDEVDSTWTLQNLQDLVTNAETHNGGWVQLTFHHIAIGTDPTLTISPALFEQFVTWLAARTANGTTVVETVAQALGTSPPPPVNKAPIAEFNSSAQNLVASFDGSGSTDSDGSVAAYGWDFGDGSAPGTGPKPTHTYAAAGTYQVKLTVTDNLGATGTVIHPLVVKLSPGPGSVVSLPPSRVMDTRTNLGVTGPVPALGTVSLQVTGQGGIPATGVSAVVVNVTAVNPTSTGYITVWPSGSTRTTTSNLNFQTGQNIPNLVVVPVGADGKIQLFNGSGGTVQLLADVTGYILGTPAPSAAPNAAASATPTPGATPLMLAPVPAQG